VEYGYDYAGRMKTMKTWKNFAAASGAATTTWNYHTKRGGLISKKFPDNNSVLYTNTPGGRLTSRTWARGIVTTYGYNPAGDLASVDYSDSTPDVSYTYDRLGRKTQVTDGAGTHDFTYNSAGQLLTESFPLAGVTVTNSYDTLLRRQSLDSGTGIPPIQFAYDAASRFDGILQGTTLIWYNYSSWYGHVGKYATYYHQEGEPLVTMQQDYDGLGRLVEVHNGRWLLDLDPPDVYYHYDYNLANQRTKRTEGLIDYPETTPYWDYSYDALGQLTNAVKRWDNTGTPIDGSKFAYTYDDIGNRKTAKRNTRSSTYTSNTSNQYTQRTVPGYVDVIGAVMQTNATVTVNGAATSRHGASFYKEVTVTNSSAATYPEWVANATWNGFAESDTGRVFVAKTPEIFGYDKDGNLTNDGRFAYSWDGENRLVSMVTQASLPASVPVQQLEFVYDAMNRRVSKVVSHWTGSSWMCANALKNVYDGWNLIAEIGTNGAVVRSYAWGLDLSDSEQGAGGVGGLLWMSHAGADYVAVHDGYGNVMGLLTSTSFSQWVAQYEYGPFGELLRATGAMANENPFRFSTKYQDEETGLLYYGSRYYNPVTGRWISRDPIGEKGGANLYGFVLNNPISSYDLLGLKGCCGPDGTVALDATLQQAENRFNSASVFGKVKGCFYMFINPITAMDAWDLTCNSGGSGQGCENTITIKGGCYHPWEVNYALYGRGAKLCKGFFFLARNQAWLYKMTIKALVNLGMNDHPGSWYGTPESIFEWSPQVSGWSKYGFDGTIPPTPNRYKDCKTSSREGQVALKKWPF